MTEKTRLFAGFGAAIEKCVAGSIRWVETGIARSRNESPNYTDLSALRSFKERKGYLRSLVEQAGTREQLGSLDKICDQLVTPNRVRHALCHDLVHPADDGNIYVTKIGNFAKGEGSEVFLTTVNYLEETLQNIRPLARQITAIGDSIFRRLDPGSE